MEEMKHRARILRTMRAWTSLDQAVAAEAMGLGSATLRRAEIEAACSNKTWGIALDYYAREHGLHWRGGEGPSVLVVTG